MTQFEQEQAAKKFIEIWKDKGNEKSEAQKFWIQLLRDVYGIEDSEQYIDFELPVKIKNTSFAMVLSDSPNNSCSSFLVK